MRMRSTGRLHGRPARGAPAGATRAAGFTLLELLIAISIFAMVSAMAYSGLNNVLRARDRVEAEREFWRGLTLVFLRMQDDFAQARPRPVRDPLGNLLLPAFVGQPTDIRALGPPSVEFTRGGVFVFDLPAEDDDAKLPDKKQPPRSDLERVAYRYNDGILYRLSWPVLDRAPTTEPVEAVMLRGVEKFEVKFFNEAFTSNLDQWIPVCCLSPTVAAPAGGTSQVVTKLPRGVQVELKLKGHEEITRLFVVNG